MQEGLGWYQHCGRYCSRPGFQLFCSRELHRGLQVPGTVNNAEDAAVKASCRERRDLQRTLEIGKGSFLGVWKRDEGATTAPKVGLSNALLL